MLSTNCEVISQIYNPIYVNKNEGFFLKEKCWKLVQNLLYFFNFIKSFDILFFPSFSVSALSLTDSIM